MLLAVLQRPRGVVQGQEGKLGDLRNINPQCGIMLLHHGPTNVDFFFSMETI